MCILKNADPDLDTALAPELREFEEAFDADVTDSCPNSHVTVGYCPLTLSQVLVNALKRKLRQPIQIGFTCTCIAI